MPNATLPGEKLTIPPPRMRTFISFLPSHFIILMEAYEVVKRSDCVTTAEYRLHRVDKSRSSGAAHDMTVS